MNMNPKEKEIINKFAKYSGNTANELLTYLKRNFRTYNVTLDWKQEPLKFVVVDDKSHNVENNKKYLVGKISNFIEDEWSHIDEPTRRRTVKKFLDGIS
jgi:hypothetical protein